jgi:hypothetical protein
LVLPQREFVLTGRVEPEGDVPAEVDVPVHVPNLELHPVPQKAEVFPQKPYLEQHWPVGQVYPLGPPQEPSLLTLPVEAPFAPPTQVPKPVWHPVPQ